MTRLVLLDRDGVLNVDRPDYVKTPEEFVLLPGAAAAVAQLTQRGWKTAICTNQSGIGRGLMSEADLDAIHRILAREVAVAGGRIDALFFCPDHPDHAGNDRKPAPGMLQKALARFGAEPARTPMVGDTEKDLAAAAAAGCPAILVLTGQGQSTFNAGVSQAIAPVAVCDDLTAAVAHITMTDAL